VALERPETDDILIVKKWESPPGKNQKALVTLSTDELAFARDKQSQGALTLSIAIIPTRTTSNLDSDIILLHHLTSV
jgi:hypothetical protein